MVEVPTGRAPVTWAEIPQASPEVTEDWEAMKRYRQRMGIQVH
jgi:dihydropyrimidine dehydrogenase (NAD+) subunit PreA